MMHSAKKAERLPGGGRSGLIGIVALVLFIQASVGYASRYGVEASSEMFDRPGNFDKNEPTSFLAYYTSDKSSDNFNLLGNTLLRGVTSTYHLELAYYPLRILELRAGMQIPFANYGPRRYSLVFGALGAAGPSAYIYPVFTGPLRAAITSGLYGGVRYEEALSYGLFLDVRAIGYANLRYPNGSWPVRLSAGITWYYDSAPENDSTTKMTMIPIEQVLQKYADVSKQDLRGDRSEKIKEIADVSRGIALRLPKFVKRGKAFNAFKEFAEGGETIDSVTCKIDTISNRLYPFKKISDTTWQSKVFVPRNYELPQVNITLYVKRKDGSGFEEYITTLVEQ